MRRRQFLATLAAGSLLSSSCSNPAPPAAPSLSRRQQMLDWLSGSPHPKYTPAAFFLHFAPEFANGAAAAAKHLEFFRHTDMDFVKIQFEQTYQQQDFLKKPADWANLKLAGIDFYEPLLVTVRDLVKAVKNDALIVMTLYSPFMCAGDCAGDALLKQHLEENPEAVKKGLTILTESQMLFVRACIEAGVDGFYMSTQGSEASRFGSSPIFMDYIKPFDLVAMTEAQQRCPFNILHVCDYVAPYASFDAVRDYPGHVVNCNPALTEKTLSWQEVGDLFRRPIMGGLDRHGLLVKGSDAELKAEIERVIAAAPRQFILGADCTVPGDLSWDRLRDAIAVAHGTKV